ncbi:MAG: hypothetical protein P8R42_22390 [Candidatus Binatia bacterium]|nr:hypothetical protein [Candidatus Binatia bacterium]
MKKFLGTMTALAVALSASAAMAGVYVSGPLPSEFTNLVPSLSSGFIPPNPDVFKAVSKASKEGSKLAGGLSKCFSKGAKSVSKGSASGVDTCINDAKKGVLTKYFAKIASIASKSPLPACHNFALDGNLIRVLTKTFNPQVYCQSPSGAFIDHAGF